MPELLKPPFTNETVVKPELDAARSNSVVSKLAFPPGERKNILHSGGQISPGANLSCLYYIARPPVEPVAVNGTKRGLITYDNFAPGTVFLKNLPHGDLMKEMEGYLDIGVLYPYGKNAHDYAKIIGEQQRAVFNKGLVEVNVTDPESFIYNPETGLIVPPPVVMVVRQYGSPDREIFGYDVNGNLFMKEAHLDLQRLEQTRDVARATTLSDFQL